MEEALQDALERADDIIETVQQQPPPVRPASSGEKSLQEKLYDIYVEECEKEPEAEGLRSNVNLLEKLMKREVLPCLVVNLYPENQGYSLMLKDKSGSFSEPFQLPYEVEKLLEYLDAEELPSFLIDVLEKSSVNVFHQGCVIAEIRDFRQCSSIYPPEDPGPEPTVSSTVPSLAYQTRHILLCPTMQSLVSDVESITSDNRQWTQEEKLELESQLLLATAEPLCLDPSVAVTCTTNRLLFNEQKMMTDPMKQSLKRHASPFLDQEEIPSVCTCPPDLATMTPCNKQAKLIPDDPSDQEIDGADTRKPRFCELTVPSEMDVQTYVDEMSSLPIDEAEPTVSAASEVNHDWMFGFNDDDLLWGLNSSILTSLNDTLFSDDLLLSLEDEGDSHLHPPPMSQGDNSHDFMTGVNTEPKKTLNVCQEPVQSKASCPGMMPQGPSTSGYLPQPFPGKKPTSSSVSSSVLEKEGGTPPPVPLVPITGQGSLAVSSNRPQAARDKPLAARDRPQAARDRPQAARNRPQAARNRPQAARDRPQAARNRPQAARDRPQAARDRPQAAGDRPQAAGDRPQAARDRPQAARNRPPAVRDILQAARDRLQAAGDRPQAAGDRPPAARDILQAARDRLQAARDRPQAAGDRPQAARDILQAARDRLQAARDRPQAARDRPQAARNRPPAVRDILQAARDRLQAARDRPQAAGDRPPAVRDILQAARDRLQAARDRPQAAGDRPQAARDRPQAAPKATTVSQRTTAGGNRVSTLPPAVQPNARPSETNPKIQHPTRVTGVSVIHVVRPMSNPSSLVGSSTQALGYSSSAPAAEGNTPNSLPTEEQLPGPSSQRSRKPPMQVIINNTANPLIIKLPTGSVILCPEPQEPSPREPPQPQQRQPQQIYVLIPKQHQPPRDPAPPQPQPASSQSSNQQPLSLPAQQTSHLNTEQTGHLNTGRTRVIQQTHTSVICHLGSTQQGSRQSSRSHTFQISTTMVHQGQTRTQNVQLRIIPRIVCVSRAASQTSQGGHTADKPSDTGPGEPPTSPRS